MAIRQAQRMMTKDTWFKPYHLHQKVWLEATNLWTTHPTAKLAPKRYGPFTITKVISNVVYQLDILQQWKINNVFHISLITPYKETEKHGPNFPKPPPDIIEGEEEWEVEQIINAQCYRRARQLQY